jgi:hypothetical protein
VKKKVILGMPFIDRITMKAKGNNQSQAFGTKRAVDMKSTESKLLNEKK